MEFRAIYLLMLYCFMNVCDLSPLIRPSNGLNECRKNSALTALEVLPGGGWDNLRNIDMGRVMDLSYSQCQTTEDGVYLIPDEVFVIPQKESEVETHSEIIMSWLEEKSSTSRSINADASFFSKINGKFSKENQRMKTHQVGENSVTARVQVHNHLYAVKAYPNFALDSAFAQQAMEIADAIKNNQTRQATYLSEKLILDYGTHVITSVDAGATLVQEDYLKKSYVSNSQSHMSSVSASAGFNFFGKVKFDIGGKDTQGSSEISEYQGNITYSLIQSHGGALFYPGITLQKWQESTLNNLVAIDRSGVPLHYFLNPSTFPDLPEPIVTKLALLVYEAAENYYQINTIPGCIYPHYQNFNFQANVNGSCEGPVTNLSFGGVYQACTPLTEDGNIICDELAQKNPATGDFSCPEPYTATLLRSETIENGYYRSECREKCHKCGFLWLRSCCDQICGDNYFVRRATINTFWCSTTVNTPNYSGYLFGGLYGPSLPNPITKSSSCPDNFIAQKLLSNGMMVCLSNDYTKGTKSSVPFGGFFSCQSGNPLAQNQSRCPPQFSQHLAAISDGCEILYCVQSSVFTGGDLKPVHLPPFTNPPLISNATNNVAIMTEGDRSWVRVGGTKTWRQAEPDEIQKALMLDTSGGEKAGLAFNAMVLVVFVVSAFIL